GRRTRPPRSPAKPRAEPPPRSGSAFAGRRSREPSWATTLAIGCTRACAAACRRCALDAVPRLLCAAEQDRGAGRAAGERAAGGGEPGPAGGRAARAAGGGALLWARRGRIPDRALPRLPRRARGGDARRAAAPVRRRA